MTTSNPDFRAGIESVFVNSPFIQNLGITFLATGPGWCEAGLAAAPHHYQHSGVIHAGVLATLADNTAGGAAFTLMPAGSNPLTIEFKINLLRAAAAPHLRCRAEVLKPGRRFVVVESAVFAVDDAGEKLVAKAMVTIAVT